MALDDAVLQLVVKLPGSTAQLAVHRDKVLLKGEFGESQARLVWKKSKDIRAFIRLLDLEAGIRSYGHPETRGIVAELSLSGRKAIVCWDYVPEEEERIKYLQAKLCVKRVIDLAKESS